MSLTTNKHNMACIRRTTKIDRGKGYLDSGSPFFPYAHSGSISSRAISPLLIVRRASSHCEKEGLLLTMSGEEQRHGGTEDKEAAASLTPLMTLPKPTLKLRGLACFFFLAAAEQDQRN